jgi:hypothetical protein
MWSQKLKARAKIKKYLQIITGVTKASPTCCIFGTVEIQEVKKIIEENSRV